MNRCRFAIAFVAILAFAGPGARADQDDPRLAPLFDQLKTTQSDDEAKMAERQIWQIWIEHKNPDHAIQCAEKAITAVDKLRKQPAPPGQTDGQWRDYLKSLDDNARNILAYAKAMKP